MILNRDSQANISFCAIYGNTATREDGGIAIVTYDSSKPSQVKMRNTLVARNQAPSGPDIAGPLKSGGYNLITIVTGAKGLNPTDRQVKLVDLKMDPTLHNNGGPTQTLALLPGSPAIGAVPGKACSIPVTDVSGHTITITTDERGVPRLHRLKNACDSGAYESSS